MMSQVKQAIRNVLLRQKVGEVMSKIRQASKVEILDEDLKKYAEEASKAAKSYQENQQKQLEQGGGMVPAAGEDSGSGKGDLQLPAQ